MRSAAFLAALVLAGCKASPPAAPTDPAPEPPSVAAAQQPSPDLSPTPPAKRLQALGTEPFWSVEVLPGQLRYSDPENIAGTEFPAIESSAGKGTRYSGTLDGQQVVLLIEPGTCSDGMSDTVYPSKAALTIGERTMQGCARER